MRYPHSLAIVRGLTVVNRHAAVGIVANMQTSDSTPLGSSGTRLALLSPQQGRLGSLFLKYGSDKAANWRAKSPFPWAPHNYADFYEIMFSLRRHDIRLLIECGIGTNFEDVESNMTRHGSPGASLRAWRDFFPNANIVGLDLDKRILFSDDRIKTFEVDQLSGASVRAWIRCSNISNVDIFVDDGLHTLEANWNLFAEAVPIMRRGGVYVIEDVSVSTVQTLFERVSEHPAVGAAWVIELDRSEKCNYNNRLICAVIDGQEVRPGKQPAPGTVCPDFS